MTAAEKAPLNGQPEPRLLTVAEYLEIGELPSGYSELEEGRVTVVPSAIVDHHSASGEMRDQIKPQLPEDLFCIPRHGRRPEARAAGRAGVLPPAGSAHRGAGRPRTPPPRGRVLRAAEVRIAIEVISRGSRRTDLVVKRAEYADAGIPHYWVLDLTEPVSLLVLHQPGEYTGRVTLTEPFPLTLDLNALL